MSSRARGVRVREEEPLEPATPSETDGEQLRLERHAALVALEALGGAVLLLQRDGRVRFASERAASLLERVEISMSELAAAVMGGLQLQPHIAMRLDRGLVQRRIEVVAQPAAPRSWSGEIPDDLVVVLLRDPAAVDTPDGETLRQLYHLTAAEARLAVVLAEGISPAEAAERLGVSLHTVRRQLKDIFAKTGVARQGALVALLARTPRTLPKLSNHHS